MPDAAKYRERTDADVMELLIRYNAATVLSLLQEVNEYTIKQSDCVKIDWETMVKNTSTGISNAREYQMLWRHLAYHDPLSEKIEDGAKPLDDDSDLEVEVESVPALNSEELAEVKECTMALISSGVPRICGSTPRPVVENSKTDMPNDQASADPPVKVANSTGGGNTPGLVSSLKPPASAGPSTEGLDGNGSGPAKKKRQLWTKEEDMELIAAVREFGEGNWANILKGDFKHNRTASQLSQRWAVIRKRHGIPNPGNGNKTTSTARSEERLAAQKAFSLAVDMPMTGNLSSIFAGASQMSGASTSSAAQASRACAAQSLNQFHEKGTPIHLLNARSTLRKPGTPGKPLVGPNPLIQAAAFAAGGRIATPSTALSLFKAAQSKNAVHIRHSGSSLPVSSTMAAKSSSAANAVGSPLAPHQQPSRPLSAQPSSTCFGTTLSSQRSNQPAGLPLASCTMATEPSSQQVSPETKPEAAQGTSLLGENTEGKSNAGTDASGVDVADLLNEEGVEGAGEMVLANPVNKDGQACCSGSPLNKIQNMAEKDDQLHKDGAPDSAMDADVGGTDVLHAEGLVESKSKQEAGALNQFVGGKNLGEAEAAADTVKDTCPESTETMDIDGRPQIKKDG